MTHPIDPALPALAADDLTKPEPSLTSVTADGAAWTFVSMGVTRLLSIVAQLALTRLLFPEDLGLVGLAMFVIGFVSFFGTLSLTQFLVARQHRVGRYVDTAFWLSLVLGGVSGVLIILAAPIAAAIYHDARLFGLLVFCGVTFPVSAAVVVPTALSQIDLRLKLTAVLNVVSMTAQVASSVLAARLGAGPYSIFIGLAAAAATRIVVLCWVMRLRFRLRPRHGVRVARVLIGNTSWWLVGVTLLTSILARGDYATMGFFFSKEDIGYYFLAYSIAQQAVVLLGQSLGAVLYPAISRLAGDTNRQNAAAMRAVKMLTLIGAPGGLLLVFLMPALVHAFGSKYLPAIPIAQVMAAGAVGVLVTGPATALMNAQERFKLFFWSVILQTGLFLSLVFIGCLTHHVLGVATAVAVYFWIGGPLGLVLALDGYRVQQATVRAVFSAIGRPAAGSLPAMAAGMLVYWVIPTDHSLKKDLLRSTASSGAFLLIVAPSLWLTMRPACEELFVIGRGVISRLPVVGRLVRA